jgi:hypothetical protein
MDVFEVASEALASEKIARQQVDETYDAAREVWLVINEEYDILRSQPSALSQNKLVALVKNNWGKVSSVVAASVVAGGMPVAFADEGAFETVKWFISNLWPF